MARLQGHSRHCGQYGSAALVDLARMRMTFELRNCVRAQELLYTRNFPKNDLLALSVVSNKPTHPFLLLDHLTTHNWLATGLTYVYTM